MHNIQQISLNNPWVEVDRLADRIPIASTLTNLVLLTIVKPGISVARCLNSHSLRGPYPTYLDHKNLAKCTALVVPVLGQIAIAYVGETDPAIAFALMQKNKYTGLDKISSTLRNDRQFMLSLVDADLLPLTSWGYIGENLLTDIHFMTHLMEQQHKHFHYFTSRLPKNQIASLLIQIWYSAQRQGATWNNELMQNIAAVSLIKDELITQSKDAPDGNIEFMKALAKMQPFLIASMEWLYTNRDFVHSLLANGVHNRGRLEWIPDLYHNDQEIMDNLIYVMTRFVWEHPSQLDACTWLLNDAQGHGRYFTCALLDSKCLHPEFFRWLPSRYPADQEIADKLLDTYPNLTQSPGIMSWPTATPTYRLAALKRNPKLIAHEPTKDPTLLRACVDIMRGSVWDNHELLRNRIWESQLDKSPEHFIAVVSLNIDFVTFFSKELRAQPELWIQALQYNPDPTSVAGSFSAPFPVDDPVWIERVLNIVGEYGVDLLCSYGDVKNWVRKHQALVQKAINFTHSHPVSGYWKRSRVLASIRPQVLQMNIRLQPSSLYDQCHDQIARYCLPIMPSAEPPKPIM